MPVIQTDAKKTKAPARRAARTRNRRKAPVALTKAQTKALLAASSPEEWNAPDDVDVFTPVKPSRKSKTQ